MCIVHFSNSARAKLVWFVQKPINANLGLKVYYRYFLCIKMLFTAANVLCSLGLLKPSLETYRTEIKFSLILSLLNRRTIRPLVFLKAFLRVNLVLNTRLKFSKGNISVVRYYFLMHFCDLWQCREYGNIWLISFSQYYRKCARIGAKLRGPPTELATSFTFVANAPPTPSPLKGRNNLSSFPKFASRCTTGSIIFMVNLRSQIRNHSLWSFKNGALITFSQGRQLPSLYIAASKLSVY